MVQKESFSDVREEEVKSFLSKGKKKSSSRFRVENTPQKEYPKEQV